LVKGVDIVFLRADFRHFKISVILSYLQIQKIALFSQA